MLIFEKTKVVCSTVVLLFATFFAVSPLTYADNCNNRTAQDVANYCAKNGLRHIGGWHSYEGLGCAATPEQAYNICCYANHSGLETVDVGYAQGRNGLWCCCRRYLPRLRIIKESK